jgi:type IV secretion system protein VirB11
VATVHAKSAGAGVAQFENLVAEATRAPKQTVIADTIQLVIFIDLDANIPAGRKVREVAVVTGYQDGRYVLEQV